MKFLLGIIGIGCAFLLLRYRQQAGDLIGDPEWMGVVGGVYNMMIIVSLFLFFWSIAYMTGTTTFFLGPLKYIIPGLAQQAV